MTFSYNDFKAKIKSEGLAKQNRYYIELGKIGVVTGSSDTWRAVALLCNSVSLPGVSLSSQPVRTTGEVHEAPYDRNFSPCTMTFYVDKDMKVRKFFDAWIDGIQNPQTRTVAYRDSFEIDAKITVLRMDEQPAYSVVLSNLYPKSIGAMNLSSENNNMMTLDVTFDYYNYTTFLNETIELGAAKSTLLGGKADLISDAIKKYGDVTGVDIDPINQTYAGFKNTLDGYYNDINGFQEKLLDSTGVLNQFGVRIDSNVATKVSQTISQASRSTVYGAVQKAFGGNLGLFL